MKGDLGLCLVAIRFHVDELRYILGIEEGVKLRHSPVSAYGTWSVTWWFKGEFAHKVDLTVEDIENVEGAIQVVCRDIARRFLDVDSDGGV